MHAVKEKLDKLKTEAAAAAVTAQSSFERRAEIYESVKAKVETKVKEVDVAKLKEQVQAVREKSLEQVQAVREKSLEQVQAVRDKSFTNLASLVGPAGEKQQPGAAVESGSDDNPHAEDERLIDERPQDSMRAGLGAIGSRIGSFGQASKSRISESLDGARQASCKSMDSARQEWSAAQAKSVERMKSAAAAGSSGVDKLRSGVADAKGRAGEAINAAAAVSGVNMPSALGGKPKPPDNSFTGRLLRRCPSLTYRQRLIGAVACMTAGTLLSLFSLGSIAQLILGNPMPFAFKYTLGNLLSLGSASFLVGPTRQCKGMFAAQRRTASILYIGTLVGTLVAVFVFKLALLSLLFIILQFL